MGYTPEEKARYNAEYYQRTRKLKGRQPGADYNTGKLPPKTPEEPSAALVAKVKRLEGKVVTLEKALSVATAALSASRQAEKKKARESSDGKSSSKEKQDSQEYRDKHQEELKAKAKKETSTSKSPSSSGGSSSSSSSSKSVSEMTSEELGSRIIKIQSALKDARQQLSSAKQKLGQLAHSAITSDPNVNEHFARFRSERIPST